MPLRNLKILTLSLAATLLMSAAAHAQVWEKLKLPEAANGRTLYSVYFLDAKQGWIVGDKVLCLSTRDGGATWETVATDSGADLRCVRFRDAQNGWMRGELDPKGPRLFGGHILATKSRPWTSSSVLGTTDGGKTWKSMWLPTNFYIPSMETAAFPVLQVATSGGDNHLDGDMVRSTDGGKTWKLISCSRALFDVRMITDKRWVTVGYGDPNAPRSASKDTSDFFKNKSCRAFFSDDGGATWKASKGSEGKGCLRSLAVAKKQPLLAVGDNGAVFRSPDNGTAWEAVKSPTTEDLCSVTWCDSLAVALGKKGTVIVSKDDGKTWSVIPGEQTQTLLSIAVAGNHVVAVGEMGTIVRTEIAKPGQLNKVEK